jgi:ABC-2 type transport system permease protein
VNRFLAGALTLWHRELVRFFRQRHRVIGSLGQPVVFWLLFGYGFGTSMTVEGAGAAGASYVGYFFPGALAMIVMFTGIFATTSVIEDRDNGFLQGVLVAPVPRGASVLGKVRGGTTIALIQSLVFLLLAVALPVDEVTLSVASLPMVIAVLFVMAFGLTALSFALAWKINNMQGFHAVMMVVLMPMWVMSGAFFPPGGVPAAFRWVMLADPMTYGVRALQGALWDSVPVAEGIPGMWPCFAIAIAFGVVAYLVAAKVARARTATGD